MRLAAGDQIKNSILEQPLFAIIMKQLLSILALIFGFIHLAFANIKLPKLVSNNMILQRDEKVKIWGWADVGENIIVTINNKNYNAVTDKDGNWEVYIDAHKAGGPYEMEIKGNNNNITIRNILFGDVWVCGGQSNMELWMGRLQLTYENEVKNANNERIRQFIVPDKYNYKAPEKDVDNGAWLPATSEFIKDFSAVAYFFAKKVQTETGVPIGLINSALGGSPAQSWISEPAIKQYSKFYNSLQKYKSDSLIQSLLKNNDIIYTEWYNLLNTNDKGINKWMHPEQREGVNWQPYKVPGYWPFQIDFKSNGVVWFNKTVQLTKEQLRQSENLILELGRLVDKDSVWVNGHFVGTTSYQYPPRQYPLNTKFLKEGDNDITIRLINERGNGGFIPAKTYRLFNQHYNIDLSGSWQYAIGASLPGMKPPAFVQWETTGLYNAMIAPLTNYSIKGIIWYQGESNTWQWEQYEALMKTLIADWRHQWQKSALPFIGVQLANFMDTTSIIKESSWAHLRNQQRKMLSIPNTGLAVTIDLGEWNDIHPVNKKDVGERLALQAMKIVYGQKNLIAAGPVYKNQTIKNNNIILSFDNNKELKSSDGKALHYFWIADSSNKYVKANAIIKSGKIWVSADEIKQPLYVRYAWADNPVGANLTNSTGIPASPFSTNSKD